MVDTVECRGPLHAVLVSSWGCFHGPHSPIVSWLMNEFAIPKVLSSDPVWI